MSNEAEVFEGEGVVKRVGSKRVGKRTYYNFTLEDDDSIYMTSTNRADVEEGDEITFEFEDTQYGNMVDLDSIEIIGHQEVKPARKKKKKKSTVSRGRSSKSATRKSSARSTSSSAKGGKDDYWNKRAEDDLKRQQQISLQASYNTALAILSKEVDLGLVKLATDKASAAKKLASFEELLKEKAYSLWAEFFQAMEKDPLGGPVEDDEIDDSNEDVDDDEAEEEWED